MAVSWIQVFLCPVFLSVLLLPNSCNSSAGRGWVTAECLRFFMSKFKQKHVLKPSAKAWLSCVCPIWFGRPGGGSIPRREWLPAWSWARVVPGSGAGQLSWACSALGPESSSGAWTADTVPRNQTGHSSGLYQQHLNWLSICGGDVTLKVPSFIL